mmetsp:Transcript_55348/g.147774  ORF Transcript_55348/g.147774 Transcript_55348/m.147774 type:complete len:144 (-) Transcript_55348:1101-1532(-)
MLVNGHMSAFLQSATTRNSHVVTIRVSQSGLKFVLPATSPSRTHGSHLSDGRTWKQTFLLRQSLPPASQSKTYEIKPQNSRRQSSHGFTNNIQVCLCVRGPVSDAHVEKLLGVTPRKHTYLSTLYRAITGTCVCGHHGRHLFL